jgi:hypothetical protein
MKYLSDQNRERMHEEMLRFGEASDKICSLLRREEVLAAVEDALRKREIDEARAAQLAREASNSLCDAEKGHWYELFMKHCSKPEGWFADKLAKLDPAAKGIEIKLPDEVRAEFDQPLQQLEAAYEEIARLLRNPKVNTPEVESANHDWDNEDDSELTSESERSTLRQLRSKIRCRGVERAEDIDDLIEQLVSKTIADLYRIWRKYREAANIEMWMARKLRCYTTQEFHRQRGRHRSVLIEADLPEPAADAESNSDATSFIENVGEPFQYPLPNEYLEVMLHIELQKLRDSHELEWQIIMLELQGHEAEPPLSHDEKAALLCISELMVRQYFSKAREELKDSVLKTLRQVQFQPPVGQLPFRYTYEELELTIEIREHSPRSVQVVLLGGEQWRGKLVQLLWQWYDVTRPDEDIVEKLYAWAFFSDEPYLGRYRAEVTIPEQLAFAPYIAYMLPKYIDPQIFEQQWQRAAAKPSNDELHRWIERNWQAMEKQKRGPKKENKPSRAELPKEKNKPSRAELWKAFQDKLRNGSGGSYEHLAVNNRS